MNFVWEIESTKTKFVNLIESKNKEKLLCILNFHGSERTHFDINRGGGGVISVLVWLSLTLLATLKFACVVEVNNEYEG